MSPTSLSWFYSSPGGNAYQIAECVRLTLWDARIGSVWLDVVNDKAPYKIAGVCSGHPIEMEWTPAEWLRLRTQSNDATMVDGLSFVLGMRPALKYVDADDYVVWEWHTGDAGGRWREVSGNPAFQHPERLS